MSTSNVGVVEVLEWLNSAGHADAAALVQTYLDARVAADGAVEEPARSKAPVAVAAAAARAGRASASTDASQAAPASPDTRALLRQLEDGNDLEEEEEDDDDDDFELDVAAAAGAAESLVRSHDSIIQPEMISESGVEIEEIDPELLVGPFSLERYSRSQGFGVFTGSCGGPCGAARGAVRRRSQKPNRELSAQLNDPKCEPLTLVYCLFRYRRSPDVTARIVEKLGTSTHPEIPAHVLHLCHLMLLEPLSSPLELFLLKRCKTSIHFALQVYWFCQGMIEDHDEAAGPHNYQRFLRMQREVQSAVGHQAQTIATHLITLEQRSASFDRRTRLTSLEATNRALSDAINIRSAFHDVTRFVDQARGATREGPHATAQGAHQIDLHHLRSWLRFRQRSASQSHGRSVTASSLASSPSSRGTCPRR